MNILFVSLSKCCSIYESGIYTDLLRQFSKIGHKVYILSPIEKKDNYTGDTIIKEKNSEIIKVYTGNIQKTNSIEKGINTILLSSRYIAAIKKHLKNIKFDLVLYPTPPVTLYNVIKYVKERDNAKTYLMLKDIFPQNAIDLGILSKNGLKGIAYKYFRNQEKKFYNISDKIGCMSQANVNYLLNHNEYIPSTKVEIFPNCIDVNDKKIEVNRDKILKKYNIPSDALVFIYGGNLGKPQDISFVRRCLKTQKNNKKSFFVVVGRGTEYKKLDDYVKNEKPENVKLINGVPKSEYNELVSSCDIGLIFLNNKFTIPNYPSRLLGYLNAGLPVFAVTDTTTDIGDDIINGNFGWWCQSDNPLNFADKIYEIEESELYEYSLNSFSFLRKNFDVKNFSDNIIDMCKKNKEV